MAPEGEPSAPHGATVEVNEWTVNWKYQNLTVSSIAMLKAL